MIICAAIKTQMIGLNEPTIIPCFRHAHGYKILQDLVSDRRLYGQVVEGFIDNDGHFLDRKEAYKHTIECGQLSKTVRWQKFDHDDKELYSEDLY